MPKFRKDNRMITIDGETKPLWKWSEESGVDPHLIARRLTRGMCAEEAVFFEPRRYKKQPKASDGQVAEIPRGPEVQASHSPRVQSE